MLRRFAPNAGFEVSSTKRYTGQFEASIIATKNWAVGEQVKCCSGAFGKLSTEDDLELKNNGSDFSVLYSSKKGCTGLFLGPARFMNHDCEPNCSFLYESKGTVSFKVSRAIAIGEELTVSYGENYFGEDNCECLCKSCESNQRGAFKKEDANEIVEEPAKKTTGGLRRSGRSKKSIDYKTYYSDADPTEKANKRKYPQDIDTKAGYSNENIDPNTRIKHPLQSHSAASNFLLYSHYTPQDKSSIKSAQESIVCCDNSRELPTIRLHNGQLYCASCYRHYRIFGYAWPTRKIAAPRKHKSKTPAKPTSTRSNSFTSLSSSSSLALNTPVMTKRKYEFNVPSPAEYTPIFKRLRITTHQFIYPFQAIPVRKADISLPSLHTIFGQNQMFGNGAALPPLNLYR